MKTRIIASFFIWLWVLFPAQAATTEPATLTLANRPFYWVIGLAVLLVISSLLWGIYLLRAIRRGKAAQAALSFQLMFRQTLSNSMPVPVYVITLEGEVENYNRAFGEFFTPELREAQQLFKPFSQTRAGKNHIGSGLGLAICREMVERMAGQIAMFSQPGVGTTMTVTLETRISNTAPAVLLMPEDVSSLPAALRIVIADDHPTNRLLLRRQLDLLGYHVDEAENGVQALDLIQQQDYDLLITDLNMPKMDGMTLTRRVREFNHQLIIWGLTANAQTDEKARCLAMGMDLCLFKPVDLQQLKAALSRVNTAPEEQSLGEFINMQTLEVYSRGDKTLMRLMLEKSRSENDKDLAAALQALHHQEWDVLRQHLHRINGSMQLLGATELYQLAEKLENQLSAGQHNPDFEPGMEQLERQLRAFSASIEAFFRMTRY